MEDYKIVIQIYEEAMFLPIFRNQLSTSKNNLFSLKFVSSSVCWLNYSLKFQDGLASPCRSQSLVKSPKLLDITAKVAYWQRGRNFQVLCEVPLEDKSHDQHGFLPSWESLIPSMWLMQSVHLPWQMNNLYVCKLGMLTNFAE